MREWRRKKWIVKAETRRESAYGCLLTWAWVIIINATSAEDRQGARGVGTHRGEEEVQVGKVGRGGRKPSRRPAAEVSLRPGMRAKKKTCPWLHVACGLFSRWLCARAKPCGRRSRATAPILSCVRAQAQRPACDDAPRPDEEQRVTPRNGARWAAAKHARDCASVCVCRLVTKVRE